MFRSIFDRTVEIKINKNKPVVDEPHTCKDGHAATVDAVQSLVKVYFALKIADRVVEKLLR